MILNNDLLIQHGFENNHPERVLSKYYLHSKDDGPEWNITVETEYVTGSNELAYAVCAWKCNDSSIITKRCQTSFIKTTEDMNRIMELCDIPVVFNN